MAETKDDLIQENAQLRADLDRVQSELAHMRAKQARERAPTDKKESESRRRLRSADRRARNQVDRIGRGIGYALTEGLQASSETLRCFTNDLFDRQTVHADDRDGRERKGEFASAEILPAGARALEDLADYPSRVIHGFIRGYDEDQREPDTGPPGRR